MPLEFVVKNYRPLVFRVVLLALTVLSANVHAARWTIDPGLGFDTTYRDSTREGASPRSTGLQTSLKPTLRLSAASGRSELISNMSYNLNRYSEADSSNEDSRFIDLNYRYFTARHTLRLLGELRSSNQFRSITEDTGVVFDDTTRDLLTLTPSWSWRINGKTSLNSSFAVRDTAYSNAGTTGLQDFQTRNASSRLSYQLSGQDQIFTTLTSSFFEFDDETRESTTTSVDLGFQHSFTPQFSTQFSVGKRNTDTIQRTPLNVGVVFNNGQSIATDSVFLESRSDSSGLTYAANVIREWARTSLALDVSRSVGVDGNRGQTITDQFRVTATRSFGARWSLSSNGRLNRSEGVDAVTTGLDRTTLTGDLALTWLPSRALTVVAALRYSDQEPLNNSTVTKVTRVTPTLRATWKYNRRWRFTASYRYSNRDDENSTGSEKTNAIGLTLLYTWPTITFSQ